MVADTFSFLLPKGSCSGIKHVNQSNVLLLYVCVIDVVSEIGVTCDVRITNNNRKVNISRRIGLFRVRQEIAGLEQACYVTSCRLVICLLKLRACDSRQRFSQGRDSEQFPKQIWHSCMAKYGTAKRLRDR